MASNDVIKSYSSAAEIIEYWMNHIMPRYFDMSKTNTYRAGTLGAISDMMATSVEDSVHAMMIARREFYPNTAQYMSSLYTHAAARFMDAPTATPAVANVLLMIQQSDILRYGTQEGDLHTFILDDTFIAYVDDIPFMLDFPITILSVERENGKYAHTTHYDFYIDNSLAGSTTEKYLPNKVMNYKGTEYVIVAAKMRQLTKTYDSQLVTSNTIVSTVTMDFVFEGSLANFEIFYKENDTSARVQLEKRLIDSGIPKVPFCWYTIVDGNTIRITFPANAYFTPKLNSTIEIEIATSLGEGGNFGQYDSDIVSENASTRYPYNTQVPIFGTVDGPSSGGKDLISKEDFRTLVIQAYCTNKTFITVNDLQLYFNELMIGTTDRFKFVKKRDDAFIRLYGAFLMMKDESNSVVPTNTLDIVLNPLESAGDFDIYSTAVKRFIIKPGALFTYQRTLPQEDKFVLTRIKGANINDDISDYDADGHWYCKQCGYIYNDPLVKMSDIQKDSKNNYTCPECGAEKTEFVQDKFIFTNPYLISISIDNFVAGYFLNSRSDHHELVYKDVNDQSIVQFIAKHFRLTRNAIAGENFYRFSVAVSPSTEVDPETIVKIDEKNIIAAKHNGYISRIWHNGTAVFAKIIYTDDPTLTGDIPENEKEEEIMVSSYIEKVDQYFYVCPQCGYRMTAEEWKKYATDGFVDAEGNPIKCPGCSEEEGGLVEDMVYTYVDFDYHTGYKLKFAIGAQISKDDVIATKMPQDLGRIRLIMDLGDVMTSSARRYIPLTIEEAEVEGTDYYVFAAYISTDDMIDSSMIMAIEDGFALQDGSSGHNQPISIPIDGLNMELHAFYRYTEADGLAEAHNPRHAFNSFAYVAQHTFTNTYCLQDEDSITLTKSLDHARGFLDAIEKPQIVPPDPEPEPDPDPEHPAGEETEIPDDPENYVYLRTVNHERFKVPETDDDRYTHRYLTVRKESKDPDPDPPGPDPEPEPEPEPPDPVWPPAEGDYGENFNYKLRNCPMLSAGWIKDNANATMFIDRIFNHYTEIEKVQWTLENAFFIDMKFYNTYGYSKFYKIGNQDNLQPLDSVNIEIFFDVALNFPASAEVFRDNFRTFVRDYIEAPDDAVGNGINIYIMNLIAAAKAKFDEIMYMEYKGINAYDYSAQRITVMSDEEILETVKADSFVPEFLNIIREKTSSGLRPKVTVRIVNNETANTNSK